MTDLMAKDLDLALAYGARAGVPLATHRHRPAGPDRGVDGRVRAGGLLGAGQGALRPLPGRGRVPETASRGRPGPRRTVPALILAADHRARGVITIERYADYLGRAAGGAAALRRRPGQRPAARAPGRVGRLAARHRTYLSINRTGLAGSAFELDDRLVASVGRAADDGWTGVKHMTRIDNGRPRTARPPSSCSARCWRRPRTAGLDALDRAAALARRPDVAPDTDDVVLAAVIAHDLGAPLLKVPVPEAGPGAAGRCGPRVVAGVGVPVLFLGGPTRREGATDVLARPGT